MSTSTRILGGVAVAGTLVIGIMIGGVGHSTPPPQLAYQQPLPQAAVLLEQATQIMRAQAEDYRLGIAQQAAVQQKLLAQHAAAMEQVLYGQAASAQKMMAQVNDGAQESRRSVSYVVNKMEDLARTVSAHRYEEPVNRQPYYRPEFMDHQAQREGRSYYDPQP